MAVKFSRQPPKSPPKTAITISQSYASSAGFELVGLLKTCLVELHCTTSTGHTLSLSMFGPELNTTSQVPIFLLLLESDLDPKPPDPIFIPSQIPVKPQTRGTFRSLLLSLGCLEPEAGKNELFLVPNGEPKVAVMDVAFVVEGGGGEHGRPVVFGGLDVMGRHGGDVLIGMSPDGEVVCLVRLSFDGTERRDKGELDFVLSEPKKPPDPSSISFGRISIISPRLESRSLFIIRNRFRLPAITCSHEVQFQALRDLTFCPPTDGPDSDRSTVALDAWGWLPIFGSGKGIKGCSELISVDSGPRFSYLFSPQFV